MSHSWSFTLMPVPPFRLDLTVWTLRRRPDNLIDRWDRETYRRLLPWREGAVEIAVRQLNGGRRPRLEVGVQGSRRSVTLHQEVAAAIERLLGIRCDLAAFYRLAEREPKLGRLVGQFMGVKPPRFPTVFEAIVNAVACQQITLSLGIQLLNKVAREYSRGNGEGGVAFPTPAEMANADPVALRGMGLSNQKAEAMIELGRQIAKGRFDPETLQQMDDDAAIERLRELRGIGRWSAEYALLRGLGRIHVFPGDDVGARGRLEKRLARRKPLDYAGVTRVLRTWRDYGGLVYFHMLLDGLAEKGWIIP